MNQKKVNFGNDIKSDDKLIMSKTKSLFLPKPNSFLSFLENRSFFPLWIGQIFSQTASSSLIFILALRVYQVSQSNAVVSGLFLVYGIPALLFGVFAGAIVDKFENKYILVFSDISRAILMILFAIMPHHFILIYLVMFINSIITQFYMPAEAPCIPYLVKKDQIVSANGLFTFTYYVTLAIGSILSGILLKIFGPTYVFLILAVFFVIAAFSETFIPKLGKKKIIKNILTGYTFSYLFKNIIKNIQEAIYLIIHSQSLRSSLLLLITTQIIIMLLGTLGPGFADKYLNIDVRDTSIVIMGPAVLGLIIGSVWVSIIGYKFRKMVLIFNGLCLAGVSLIFIRLYFNLNLYFHLSNYINPLIVISFLFFTLGFSNSMLDIPANSLLQEKSEDNIRGKVYGLLSSAVGGIGMFPVIFGGIIADIIGVENVIMGLGIFILIFTIVYKFYIIKMNH